MDAIFKALNDPARRAILDSLRAKDGQTLTELEALLPMTRFGVMKHLAVLEAAGLVVPRRTGRFKHHYLNALPLQEALDRWIEPFRQKPAARALITLKSNLERDAAMPDTTKPDFLMQTFIRTTPDRLWAALTDPEAAASFHFIATSARGRLIAPGDRMEYFGPDGRLLVAHEVTAITPVTRLELTFEPHWAGPGVPASRCVYTIAAEGDACRLTVEHWGIPPGQEGIADGWARMVSGLKTWLETGRTARFSASAAR